jgi:hypothetical protein
MLYSDTPSSENLAASQYLVARWLDTPVAADFLWSSAPDWQFLLGHERVNVPQLGLSLQRRQLLQLLQTALELLHRLQGHVRREEAVLTHGREQQQPGEGYQWVLFRFDFVYALSAATRTQCVRWY